MPTGRKSAATSKRSPRSAAKRREKHSALGRRLIASARAALAHARGELDLPSYEVDVPKSVDTGALRRNLGLSQREFAARYGVHLATLQAWEQGRRRPDRTARVLLCVIAREPDAVRRALAGAA